MFAGSNREQLLRMNNACDVTRNTKRYLKHISEAGQDLLYKLLEVDPIKRFSAEEALKH